MNHDQISELFRSIENDFSYSPASQPRSAQVKSVTIRRLPYRDGRQDYQIAVSMQVHIQVRADIER